jgi:mercuric ion binding protein
MMKYVKVLTLIGALAMPAVAAAAERTVTFNVSGMTCASCPYMVKKSMTAVGGVSRVEVSYEAKQATVTFDDAKTTADAIGAASTNAGFPARLAKQGN